MAFFEPISAKLTFNNSVDILHRNVILIERKLQNIKEGKFFFFALNKRRLPLYRFSQQSQVVSGIT